jgi:hypothetical protein
MLDIKINTMILVCLLLNIVLIVAQQTNGIARIDKVNTGNVTHIVKINITYDSELGIPYYDDELNATNPENTFLEPDPFSNTPISNRSGIWYRRISQTTKLVPNMYTTVQYINCNSDRILIQHVINLMAWHSYNGVIVLGSGEFILDYYINLNSNISIHGSGVDVTKLKLVDNSLPFIIGNFSRKGMIRVRELLDNVVISNMTLDGNKQNQRTDRKSAYGKNGIHLSSNKNILIENVVVKNFQGSGIVFDAERSWIIQPDNLNVIAMVRNSVIENNNLDGIRTDQYDRIVMRDLTIKNNRRHGLNFVRSSTNINVTNCVVSDNGFNYNDSFKGCGVMIQNMLVYNNKFWGTKNIGIFRNTMHNNNRAGICLNDIIETTIEMNHIASSCSCFDIENTHRSIFNNNYCETRYLYSQYNSILSNSSIWRSYDIMLNNISFLFATYDTVSLFNNSFLQTDCNNSSNDQQVNKSQPDGAGVDITDFDVESNRYDYEDSLTTNRWDQNNTYITNTTNQNTTNQNTTNSNATNSNATNSNATNQNTTNQNTTNQNTTNQNTTNQNTTNQNTTNQNTTNQNTTNQNTNDNISGAFARNTDKTILIGVIVMIFFFYNF